jgi:hypothetical protein
MQIVAREVRNYITPAGRAPFCQWLIQLRDKKHAQIFRDELHVYKRNFGNCKRLAKRTMNAETILEQTTIADWVLNLAPKPKETKTETDKEKESDQQPL